MSALQRSITLTLIVGIAITGGYIVYTQQHPQRVSSHTSIDLILGVLGLAAIVGTLRYRARPLPGTPPQRVKDPTWHMTIGNLALLIILLHSGFLFGSLTSIVIFLCLTMLVVSGMLSVLASSPLDIPAPHGQSQAKGLRPLFARQFLVDLHIYLTALLLAFSLVHILVILYY